MANVEFGTGKTVIILSIVAACFAVLWPKIFYPMFMGSPSRMPDSSHLDGCCDVIFDTDINAIKIMNDLCGSILNRQAHFNPKLSQAFQQGKLSKEVINTCRTEVMNKCGIDIAEFLNKKEKIGHSYKQMLDEIRSFNISICLRHNFGVNPALLGAPRRMRIWSPSTPRHLRQERPLNFRQEIIHPALREKGRAIPQSHIVPKVSIEKDARAMPLPGMRPPMGGAGHVVPPPKTGGSISVIMPIYTVGIILFFTYTVMKIFSRKTAGDSEYKEFHSDPEFRRVVFSEDYSNGCAARIGEENPSVRGKQCGVWKSPSDDSTRLGWKERDTIMTAITGLLAEVDQQLNREGETQNQYSTELKGKKNLGESYSEEVQAVKKVSDLSRQIDLPKKEAKNGHVGSYKDLLEEPENTTKPKVKVIGMEMMAECEGGQKWSRPATPNLGVGGSSRSTTPIPPSYSSEPQNIFLEGALPQQSQLLVTDSKTQTLTLPGEGEPEPPVILSSKMSLSFISLDSALPEEQPRQDEPPSIDFRSDCDDNLGTADSTLLDVDSDVIDETGQNEYESFGEEGMAVSVGQQANEMSDEKPSPNYTSATSERADAGLESELEDTGADVSNLDGLDMTEDQEYLQNENIQLCNGNSRETDEPHQVENGDLRQQS